jgi:hypothetical protein
MVRVPALQPGAGGRGDDQPDRGGVFLSTSASLLPKSAFGWRSRWRAKGAGVVTPAPDVSRRLGD